ncbi:MAG: N-acetyl-anhydromuranmyl-L-alanine amidase [Moraxellaceae bacterium]|jgi:AmpD protein|nr:N-acetyl-anhydromuranmyl-L-alanine amidase [Moraxellaceae bacterium]
MEIGADHWLRPARHCPSPNCNPRPADAAVGLVVVHGISLPPGEFGGPFIDELFTNSLDPARHPYFAEIAGLTVSSHLLIRRDGEVVQYVPFDLRAWHAGRSAFRGVENCNDFSIGIELEGTDDIPYEAAQYHRLAEVIRTLNSRYPSTFGHLAGHSDIAPGRKTDPGPAFDWGRLHALLASDKE